MQADNITAVGRDMTITAQKVHHALTSESLDAIGHFVSGQMNSDGGFKNRSDESDLYYTYFGVACLEILQKPIPWHIIVPFLERFKSGKGLDLIHLSCLSRLLARLPEKKLDKKKQNEVMNQIERYHTENGGYRLSFDADHDSIYASFLALLAHEDSGLELKNPSGLITCCESLKANDGGYADQPNVVFGTTPVTAAAAVLLTRLGNKTSPSLADWLMQCKSSHGGFRATPDAPMPDLLSTATSLYALQVLECPLDSHQEQTLSFIESLWEESGGFCGHIADPIPDCEYTFYGLLSLGVLSDI